MEYDEAINRLEGLRRVRPKLGTETTAALLRDRGDPHEELRAVQIAGSNGKGSTARFLERILLAAGFDVGLYTSPDLNGLRERIRVGGQPISKDAVARFVEAVDPAVVDLAAGGSTPTYFEVVTALALWCFERADVDVAVLEVGIGGRHDATSVVDPVAAAVTSVSLEHTGILGETVEAIAADKAAVAPSSAPLVTGATGEALSTIRRETEVVTVDGESRPGTDGGARAEAADVIARETGMATPVQARVSLTGPDWEVQTTSPLLGAHQALNAGIAATLARQLGGVEPADIAAGVRSVDWPGRFEVMARAPLVVLDGAHNPAACETTAALLSRFDVADLTLVFGAMREKDHAAMARALPAVDRALVTAAPVDRAQDPASLAAVLGRETDASVETVPGVERAVARACETAGADDAVLVTGSLSVVAAARDRWTRAPRRLRTDTAARAARALRAADVSAARRDALADRLGARTWRFHARRELGEALRRRTLAAGGTAAISGIRAPDRHVEVLLSGTPAQIAAVREWLGGRDDHRARLAAQLEPLPSPEPGATTVVGTLDAGTTPRDVADAAGAMVARGAGGVEVGAGRETTPAELIDAVRAVADRVPESTVSIATAAPDVARRGLAAGADVVTDRSGLADGAMRRLLADREVRTVATLAGAPEGRAPADGVDAAFETLTERLIRAERDGIDRSRVVIDPGLSPFARAGGIDRLSEFRALASPVAVELTAGAGTGAAAAALAADRGADLVRVDDVAAAVAGIDVSASVGRE